MVESMRSKLVETFGGEYPDKHRSPSVSTNAVSTAVGCEEPDGFEVLNRVRGQLDSLRSGKGKLALGMIAAAAKVWVHSVKEKDSTDVCNI